VNRSDHFDIGASPVEDIAQGARTFQTQNGIHVPERNYGRVAITQPAVKALGDAYDALPDFDPKAIPAYKAFAEETGRQYDHITKPRSKGGLGIDINVTPEDPYGKNSSRDIVGEIRDDVLNHNRINVFSTKTTGGHPALTDDQNDMFRGVHDIFGHLASGRGIDRHGEEAAFQKHSAMYSPLARSVMATETRGQNAALHKHGEFQDQKVAILPQQMQQAQFGSIGNWADRALAAQNARIENQRQGL
jgi:hypothetical protein